jgi:hypothetical protein
VSQLHSFPHFIAFVMLILSVLHQHPRRLRFYHHAYYECLRFSHSVVHSFLFILSCSFFPVHSFLFHLSVSIFWIYLLDLRPGRSIPIVRLSLPPLFPYPFRQSCSRSQRLPGSSTAAWWHPCLRRGAVDRGMSSEVGYNS